MIRNHGHSTSRRRWLSSAALVAVLALSACADSGGNGEALPQYDPVPTTVEAPAEEANSESLRLPLQFNEAPIVDPAWQTPPQYAEGVFLSADHTGDVLTFRAVDTTGTVLWEADRPLSCTGFTLTSQDEATYAVLTDIDAEVQGFDNTVAAAYDLHTGELAWGPVDVPGPHLGPGTVFGAPTEQAMGESGPTIVLDPASGEVLVDETQDDVRILGEFHGTVLTSTDEHIQAHHASALSDEGLEAEPLWTLDLAQYDWDNNRLSARSPVALADPTGRTAPAAVLIGTNDNDRALINVATAEILAEDLSDAGQDPSSQTWVTIGETLNGYDPTGKLLYEEPHQGLSFRGIGAAMAYLENAEGELQAHNVVTGKLGRSYDPDETGTLAVPTVITAPGAGAMEADGRYYLATVPEVEQPDDGSS